jgi:4-amino-4-deoxy-L-arabinose transferase-like glycosyltransferase
VTAEDLERAATWPAPAPPPGRSAPSARLALGVLLLLLILRLAYALLAPPNSDEAYYWLWGRHPALSYLDHPPLHAWLQGLAHALLGTSLAALRLGPALTSVCSGWILWRLTRRLAPGDEGAPPLAVAAAFASPLFAMLAGFGWNDHLLLLGWLLAGWLALEFLDEVARGGRGRTALVLGAGLALGLAGLSKYSAVFLGLAVALVVTRDPRLRHLWRDPRLWLAGLLALAVVSPVLLWNAAHGGASFRFHLTERIAGGGVIRLSPLGPVRFLLPLLAAAGPFLVVAVLRPAAAPAPGSFAALHRRLALVALALPTAFFTALSLFTPAIYYWDVVGWLLLLPVAATAGRPRLLRAHLASGVAALALMTAHATLLPLTVPFPSVKDDDSRMTWGWDEVALAVRAERAARPGAFVVASDYRSASSLAFALDDPGVRALSRRPSQFDEWLDAPALQGHDAVVVVEAREPMEAWLAGHFRSVRRLQVVEARRLGWPVKRYELWLGEAFRGAPLASTRSTVRRSPLRSPLQTQPAAPSRLAEARSSSSSLEL